MAIFAHANTLRRKRLGIRPQEIDAIDLRPMIPTLTLDRAVLLTAYPSGRALAIE